MWPLLVGIGIEIALRNVNGMEQIISIVNIVGIVLTPILIFYYMFWPYVVLGEGLRDKKALERSKSFWKGNRKFIFGRLLFGFLVTVLTSGIFLGVLNIIDQELVTWILNIAYTGVVAPISVLYMVFMYEWLRSIKKH